MPVILASPGAEARGFGIAAWSSLSNVERAWEAVAAVLRKANLPTKGSPPLILTIFGPCDAVWTSTVDVSGQSLRRESRPLWTLLN